MFYNAPDHRPTYTEMSKEETKRVRLEILESQDGNFDEIFSPGFFETMTESYFKRPRLRLR